VKPTIKPNGGIPKLGLPLDHSIRATAGTGADCRNSKCFYINISRRRRYLVNRTTSLPHRTHIVLPCLTPTTVLSAWKTNARRTNGGESERKST